MKKEIIIEYVATPCGDLILGDYQDELCLCDWKNRKARTTIDHRLQSKLNASFVEGNTSLLNKAKQELQEYFAGKRSTFGVPLCLAGTEFQQGVWNALLQIPYGQTSCYSDLSKVLGNEKAVRAVANANGANAISIFIPCHRIIGRDGSLTGYAGGLEAKQKLLDLETGKIS